MDYEKNIEIPFGAKDSELKGWEYTIPEGMEAIIKDGKVIVREKASEDDRIRKYLIEELKAAKSVGELKFTIPQPTREECIAYLERQKEEEGYEAIPVESTLEYKLGFKAGKESEKQKEQKHKRERNKPKESWLSKVKYELAHEEELLIKRQKELSEIRALKNKEQKSAEYGDDVVEEAEEYISKVDCGEYGVAVTEAYIAGVLSERNRKPAEWSENDKKGLDNCCAIIAMPDTFFDKIIRQKCLDFLYELPERFNLQPKQEWSEEDEKMRYFVTEAVQSRYSDRELAKYLEPKIINEKKQLKQKLFDWLRDLRPSWKPSEEQMEVLERASTNEYLSAKQFDILVSLYEQLKKL